MPAQLDLFESQKRQVENISHAPSARANDADTAKAAGEPNHGTDRWTALRVLRDAGLKGMTDFELGDAMERQQTSAGKRRLELQRAGYVRDSGMRRPAPSGSMAIVWVVGMMMIAVLSHTALADSWQYPTSGVKRVVVAPVAASTSVWPYASMECSYLRFGATAGGGVVLMAQVGYTTNGVGYRQVVTLDGSNLVEVLRRAGASTDLIRAIGRETAAWRAEQ